MPAPSVTIVVPTLNEGPNIDPLLEALFAIEPLRGRLEVVIADDSSSDDTPERVQAWARTHAVKLLQRTGPPDLAAAVIEGARAGGGEFVVVMDADGSHPPERIPALIEALETGACDIAVGSRHTAGGAIEEWPWYRRLMSRLAAVLAWPFAEVRDPMSGFFACERSRLAELPAERAGYKILLEMLVRSDPPPRTTEIPIRFQDRERGQSKLGLRTQWVFLQRLAALGGARMSLGNASKFGLVGLSGMAVDFLVYQIMLLAGMGLAGAHMTSFAVAALSNFALNYRWTFSGAFPHDEPVLPRYLRLLAVALLALILRIGIIEGLVHEFGLTEILAIVPAILITAGVNYLGSIFYVFPTAEAKARKRIRWRLAALALIAYLMALRVLYFGQIELLPDEMYYWVYTLHPALSYLDHPPLTAWLITLGTAVAGVTPFGVRLPVLVLAPLGTWFAFLYGRDLLATVPGANVKTPCRGKSGGLLTACLFCAIPAYFAGGLLMVPDTPMIVAWIAALYFFQRALVYDNRWAFLGLGLAMGLGLLAKYTIALLAPAALLYMLLDQRARRWLARPEPYLAVLLAVALFSPVLIWNWQHDAASFVFQFLRRPLEQPTFSVHMIALTSFLMLGPPAAIAAMYALGPVRKVLAAVDRQRLFILVMTLVPLTIMVFYGLFSHVKFHWATPVWLALLPLIAATALPAPNNESRGEDRPLLRLFNRLWGPVLVIKAIFFGLVLHYFAFGLPGAPWTDGDSGYLGWPETAAAVSELERALESETGKRPLVAGMSKWSVASALSFHDPTIPPDNITSRNLVGEPATQWEAWFDPQTDPGRPVILVNFKPKLIEEDWLEDVIVELGPLERMEILRQGRHIRTLYYRIGYGFDASWVRDPEWNDNG